MYTPPHFTTSDPDTLYALMREHPLGMLVTHGESGLDANHLPFELLESDAGHPLTLLAHVARANPVWQQVRDGMEVMVVFRAEQAYISPNWYPSKHVTHQQVPTWNYRVVHAHGTITVRDDEKFVRGVVGRLTRTHEARTQSGSAQAYPGWKMSDAEPAYLQRMLGAIVGLEVQITRLEGKFKLGQNRTTQDLQGAADGVEAAGHSALAQHMRHP